MPNPRSLLLEIGAVNGLILAALILSLKVNRTPNRLLATLILLVTWRLGPYVLGFSGVYDHHPDFTFFPFDFSLAFGPLLWGYVQTLTGGAVRRVWLHLLPGGVQFAYWTACFLLPLPLKWDWYTGAHLHIIAVGGLALTLVSTGLYVAIAWRRYERYRSWMDENFVDRDRARLGWLAVILMVFAAAWTGAVLFAAVAWTLRPLTYVQRYPLMLGLCALVYVLGLLGWRYGEVDYPALHSEGRPIGPRPPDEEQPGKRARADYASLVEAWRVRIVRHGWHTEEGLTLAALAHRLGASNRTVSRALSESSAANFNNFINGLRVRTVEAALSDTGDQRDLLQIAYAAGFTSKASFNRAFKAHAGTTPSAYRKALRDGIRIRQTAQSAQDEAISGGV